MSNVLTQDARKQMMRTTRARFLLTGALMLSVTAVVALLALLPAYLATAIPRAALSNELQVSKEQLVQEESDREIASRTRVFLAAFAPFAEERPSIYSVIETATAVRPSGVDIHRITYQAGSPGEITIIGTAPSREHVSAYREALATNEAFDSVSVPVAALVGASEGNFTMTLQGKF